MSDLAWSQTFIGTNNGDDLLEDGEKAEITVQLGAPLTVQRAIPPGLRNVMNLN